MMKLKVLKGYTDLKLNKKISEGTILEVSEERGLELLEKARQNRLLDFAIIKISKLSKKIV